VLLALCGVGVGWYIKVCIDEDIPEVAVISFHPPTHPMKTKAGIVRPPVR